MLIIFLVIERGNGSFGEVHLAVIIKLYISVCVGVMKLLKLLLGNEHISKQFILIDLFTNLLFEILSHMLEILLSKKFENLLTSRLFL